MFECNVCGFAAKSEAGLKVHQRKHISDGKLKAKVDPSEQDVRFNAESPDEYKVGEWVQHRRTGEKFIVEDIDEIGRLARRINARDPLKWYRPTEVLPFDYGSIDYKNRV